MEQVARVRVALGPRRDVELELRVDAVGVGAADVVGTPVARSGGPVMHSPQRRLAIEHAQAARAADEDLVLVEQLRLLLELDRRRGSSSRRGGSGSRG